MIGIYTLIDLPIAAIEHGRRECERPERLISRYVQRLPAIPTDKSDGETVSMVKRTGAAQPEEAPWPITSII
jgi:hypothetical protein